jgi:hypothetical protein
MKSKLRYVGLDVHVDSITVAMADDGGEARSQPDRIVSPPAMRPNALGISSCRIGVPEDFPQVSIRILEITVIAAPKRILPGLDDLRSRLAR